MPPASKPCAVCGREITWRKKWERAWPEVKYCSEACRQKKATVQHSALEPEILRLLHARARGATICPSEVARAAAEDWRPLMPLVRDAARRLVAQGAIDIVQKGHVVDPSTARGAIRLRLKDPPAS